MSETEIRHASPEEGFDRSEPKVGSIVGFALGSVVVLVATTGATRAREIADFQRSPDFPVGKVRGVVLVSGTGASL